MKYLRTIFHFPRFCTYVYYIILNMSSSMIQTSFCGNHKILHSIFVLPFFFPFKLFKFNNPLNVVCIENCNRENIFQLVIVLYTKHDVLMYAYYIFRQKKIRIFLCTYICMYLYFLRVCFFIYSFAFENFLIYYVL